MRRLRLALIVGGLAVGCAAPAEFSERPEAQLSRELNRCERRPIRTLDRFYECERAYSETCRRFKSSPYTPELELREISCEAAVASVDAAEHFSEEFATPYVHEPYDGRTLRVQEALHRHGRRLLVCNEDVALERFLGGVARGPASLRPRIADHLVEVEPDRARALAKRDPDSLVATALQPPPSTQYAQWVCTTEVDALRAMQSSDPITRAFGCRCVDNLPPDARAEASELRARLAEEDPYVETQGGSGRAIPKVRGIAALPIGIVETVLAPLEALARRTTHPVREYCREHLEDD